MILYGIKIALGSGESVIAKVSSKKEETLEQYKKLRNKIEKYSFLEIYAWKGPGENDCELPRLIKTNDNIYELQIIEIDTDLLEQIEISEKNPSGYKSNFDVEEEFENLINIK